jgi:hypothetical protein
VAVALKVKQAGEAGLSDCDLNPHELAGALIGAVVRWCLYMHTPYRNDVECIKEMIGYLKDGKIFDVMHAVSISPALKNKIMREENQVFGALKDIVDTLKKAFTQGSK